MSTKTLLEVTVYEFTGAELSHLNGLNLAERHTDSILPEYCLLDDRIDDTEYICQFYVESESLSNSDKVEKIIMFDMRPISNLLSEEFSALGGMELINDYCFKEFHKIVTEHCHKIIYEEFNRTIPIENYMVIDINYTKSYDSYSGAFEYDMEIELIGYLDCNMELKQID